MIFGLALAIQLINIFRISARRFRDDSLEDFHQLLRIVGLVDWRGVVALDQQLETLQQGLQLQDHLVDIPDFHAVNTTFLPRQVLLPNLGCDFHEGPEVLLRQPAILLAFESLEGGQDSLGVEKRISYLINDILTGSVQGVAEFRLDLVEVVEDRFLEEAALRLHRALHCELLGEGVEVLLEEQRGSVEVVLPQALLAGAALAGLAVLAEAEVGYPLSVLALVHT